MRRTIRPISLTTTKSKKDIKPRWKSTVSALALLALALAAPVLSRAQISNFQHVVIIFQENRTPDNLFQGLCGTNNSLCPSPYDIVQSGVDNQGATVPLVQIPLGSLYDAVHRHQNFVDQCHLDEKTNECQMKGLPRTGCPSGQCSFVYVDPADVVPYTTMAQQYGWSNFFFQTNQGPSSPAHAIIFSGTSAPSAADDASAIFVSEWKDVFGCLTPLNDVYYFISPQTAPKEYTEVNNPLGSFCFNHDSMATLLDGHDPAVSWKYYTPSALSIWDAVSWFQDLCLPNAAYTRCTSEEWQRDADVNP